MDYEKLSDFDINKAVAVAKGLKIHPDQSRFEKLRSEAVIAQEWLTGRFVEFEYCNNPADAWPVIIENEIDIRFDWDDLGAVTAMSIHADAIDKNPLRAAMICFLKMQEDI